MSEANLSFNDDSPYIKPPRLATGRVIYISGAISFIIPPRIL